MYVCTYALIIKMRTCCMYIFMFEHMYIAANICIMYGLSKIKKKIQFWFKKKNKIIY